MTGASSVVLEREEDESSESEEALEAMIRKIGRGPSFLSDQGVIGPPSGRSRGRLVVAEGKQRPAEQKHPGEIRSWYKGTCAGEVSCRFKLMRVHADA